jgi:sporulation protein YlmC with PRC-barrel domain
MRNRNLITALVAGGLALGATHLTAQGYGETSQAKTQAQPSQQGHDPEAASQAGAPAGASDFRASSIIGLTVRNESGDRLGKVQDLIVNLTSQSTPFAIIEYGGAVGLGVTRIAVPLTDLKWSNEPKQLTLTATKEQLEAASPLPTGGWAAVAGEDWLSTVDRFYGQPSTAAQAHYERQEATGMTEGRESVRYPAQPPAQDKGTNGMLNQQPGATPGAANTVATDQNITDKVNGVVRQNMGARAGDIQVTIKDGVVILQGKAASEAQKQELENQIKGVAGVDKVEDHLRTLPAE